MISTFDVLDSYGGINGYFVYDTKTKTFISYQMPEDVPQKQAQQFISMMLAKQEIMDITADLVLFHRQDQRLGLSRKEGLLLGFRCHVDADLQAIQEKVAEVWVRQSLQI
jgi:hypothetical protein